MTHAELNPGLCDDELLEFKSQGPAVIRSHRDWRGAVDYTLSRIFLALLVLWATWATWQYAILYTANANLSAALGQQQAAYQQLQQQAQQAVSQLQGEIKQLKGGQP